MMGKTPFNKTIGIGLYGLFFSCFSIGVTLITLPAIAQEQVAVEVEASQLLNPEFIASYNENSSTWEILQEGKNQLQHLGIEEAAALELLEKIRSSQQLDGVDQGIKVLVNLDHELAVKEHFLIAPDTISMSETALLVALSREQVKYNAFKKESRLSEHVQLFLRSNNGIGVMQTQDPIKPIFVDAELKNLEKVIGTITKKCPLASDICTDGKYGFNESGFRAGVNSSRSPTEGDKQCSVVRNKFSQQIEQVPGALVNSDGDWTGTRIASEIAKEFDKACLLGSEHIPKEVLNRFAVLKMPKDKQPFCSALRIGPVQFLTAMHCFQNTIEGVPDDNVVENVQFFMFSKPRAAIKIDQTKTFKVEDRSRFGNDPDDPFNIKLKTPALRDHVVVTVKPFDDATVEDFVDVYGAPSIGSSIIVPGYFVYHGALTSEKLSTGEIVEADWTDGVRIDGRSDSETQCRIFDISNSGILGCMAHNCQALPGFSGAPVLQKKASGEHSVVGVHVVTDDTNLGDQVIKHHCQPKFVIGEAADNDATFPVFRKANIASMINKTRLENLGWTQAQ